MVGPWSELAALELSLESVELVPRSLALDTFTRHTTVVRFLGDGECGLGEDPTYDLVDHEPFRRARIEWPRGRFDLNTLSRALDDVRLFERAPRFAAYRDYRRWAVESAALDLALRQAGRSLAAVLDIAPRPVRFVTSTGLGNPPTMEALDAVLARAPAARFKLDAHSGWSRAFLERLAARDVVDVIDFKGAYPGKTGDPALYRRVAETMPNALLEDPMWDAATAEALAPYRERVSWDAPIHGVADLEALPFPPRVINVKPSRFGTLASLFEAYAYCDRYGIAMYGGGQFEIDAGRTQIQALASLFHPDAPNDVAPVEYHRPGESDVLPSSPLVPRPAGEAKGIAGIWCR